MTTIDTYKPYQMHSTNIFGLVATTPLPLTLTAYFTPTTVF